jgi:hypothetical protein
LDIYLFSLTPVQGGGFWFARALVFQLLGATAGFMLALFFIFFDPCAGRRLLLLLRQKK